MLLCSPCHDAIRRDGWVIRVVDGNVRLIPAPHVDPDERPRIGRRARFELDQASGDAAV